MDLNDTIELLTSAPPAREPSFPFERAVRLFQFQTWIYYPMPSEDMVQMAGQIVATEFLQMMELGVPYTSLKRHEKKVDSRALGKFLKDPEYRLLFDSVIGKTGGWSHLLYTLEPSEFDERIRKRRETAETVCKMIDYRFRYLDHGGADQEQANISHSEFYRWKESNPKLSWRTIRTRWRENKESAAFLYASENFDFTPIPIMRMGFLSRLVNRARDVARIRRFFGYVAYVIESLETGMSGQSKFRIPRHVKRIRPQTGPLTEEEQNRMLAYKAERDEMRDG
jgi:hypothetical protein